MDPRVIFHLFRTDARRMRWLIIATLVLLAVDFGICMFANEWWAPSQRSSSWDAGDLFHKNRAPQLLRIGGFCAAFLAAGAGFHGLAWSRTRPVRRREAAAAKVAFLCAFLVLPQLIMVSTVLLRHHLPLRDAMLGTLAAAGVFVPLWIMMTALGRLAGSGIAFTGGLVLIAGGAGLASLFDEKIILSFFIAVGDPWGQYAGPHSWYFLGSSAAALLVLMLFTSKRWKTPVRLLAAAAVVVALAWHWRLTDWFRISNNFLTSAVVSDEVLKGVQAVPPTGSFDAVESQEKGRREISVTGSFGTAGLPPGVFAWWQPSGKASLLSEGKVIAEAKSRFIIEGRPQLQALYPPRGTPMDQASLLAALPENARLVKEDIQGIKFGSRFTYDPAHLGQFSPVEPGITLDGRQVGLRADMTAILYRYEVLAGVALDKPFVIQHGALCIHVRRVPGVNETWADVAVQCPSLGLSDDPLTVSWMMNPFTAWRVFLFKPASGEVLEGNAIYSQSSPLLGGGGIHRQVYGFSGQWQSVAVGDTTGARLIILQPRLLGVATREVITPPAMMKIAQTGANDYYAMLHEPSDFRLSLPVDDPRRPDPALATREEFGEWLRMSLRHRFNGWLESELERWVPAQWEIILNIKPFSSDHEFEWCKAVSAVLPDSQKNEVIRSLPGSPWLTWVIRRRGWEREARTELLQLFNSGREMNMSGLQSVASLEEPETYDRLLSMLETSGKMELYEAIRRLPGIEPRLTESVRRYFEKVTVHGREPAGKPEYHNPHAGRLSLPLRHGLPGALSDALAVFRWENPVRKGTHSFATDIQSEYLLRFLIAPPNIEGRSRPACEFLAALKPENCRFDPLTRRWITPGAQP